MREPNTFERFAAVAGGALAITVGMAVVDAHRADAAAAAVTAGANATASTQGGVSGSAGVNASTPALPVAPGAGEREVQLRGGVGFVNPVGDGSADGNAVAAEIAAVVDVFKQKPGVRLSWYKHITAGLRARFARVPEVLEAPDGTAIEHEVGTEAVDASISWQPHLTSGGALRLDIGTGVGVGHVDGRELPDDMSVNGETSVTNPWDLGVTLTGRNVGVRVGGNCTVAGERPLQICGGSVQAVVKF